GLHRSAQSVSTRADTRTGERASGSPSLWMRARGRLRMLDSFEINKVLGAILGTLLITLALNIFTGAIFTPKKPEKAGYEIAVTELPAAGGGAVQEQEAPLPELLAKADPQKGATVGKKCLTCHDFTKGGPNKVGPNLYGIVGRDRAAHEGFSYSGAMKAK